MSFLLGNYTKKITFLDQDMGINFLLTDTVYAKGKIPKDVRTVNLWLGANVMVEFTFDEAKNLLKKNLENAQGNLKSYVNKLKK